MSRQTDDPGVRWRRLERLVSGRIVRDAAPLCVEARLVLLAAVQVLGAVLVALLGVSYLQWAILTVYGTAVGVLAVFLTQALNRAESRWADGPARKFAGCRRCPSVLRFDSSSGHWQHISQAVADDYGPHDPLPERPGA